MARKKTRPGRPTFFKIGSYRWTIEYLDVESDNHGLTYYDRREIQIYTRDRDEITIRDTLCHEILHVAFQDVFSILAKIEDRVSEIEEHAIRLVTPRLMDIYQSNKELVNYIYGGTL